MDAKTFDILSKAQGGGNRRSLLGRLGASCVSALSLAVLGNQHDIVASARRKSRAGGNGGRDDDRLQASDERKRKRKKKKKSGVSPTAPQGQPNPPTPPPAPPPLQSAFECAPTFNFTYDGGPVSRFAQSFKPSKSGKLRQVDVAITKVLGTTGDYVVQLVASNGDLSASGADVLALMIVPDDDVPVGDSILSASFNGPQIVGGVSYGVSVSRPGSEFKVRGRMQNTGNACLGKGYHSVASSDFLELYAGEFDAIFSVLVD